IWAHPDGSSVSMMKSSRLRLELGARQKMPRLQMSPMCIGVVVIWVVVQVALPGISPPPPSQVVPPFLDQITYMSYSQDVSLCTVPAADSAEQVAGFEFKLFANPKYGLPWLSVVKPTNGVDASWPMPASKACCAVQVSPLSSE